MSDDLFAEERRARRLEVAPLADRMRPVTLDEVVGQEHLLGEDSAFRVAVESGRPPSMVLWGPPGSGKTTLARLIAHHAAAEFAQLSATSAGVKDVREVLAGAARRVDEAGTRTILFLDEIHRFTKAQQDALLPAVETGTVILVGATTENPFFEVNAPLVSRCVIFRLYPLPEDAVAEVVRRALSDPDRGLPGAPAVSSEAITVIAERAGGDARLALTTLQLAVTLAERAGTPVEPGHVIEAMQRGVIRYDRAGDRHYDVLSAFIKSMRGSDPDAALFWLHTMLEAGEDPELIARRMVILASEDVGLADSGALEVAVAAAHALQFVGLPEATYALSHAALYLALAPKSNSIARAISESRRAVSANPGAEVPLHLRQAAHPGLKSFGHGTDYLYPHDHPGGIAPQQYLPDGVDPDPIYRPVERGEEAELAARLDDVDDAVGRGRRPRAGS